MDWSSRAILFQIGLVWQQERRRICIRTRFAVLSAAVMARRTGGNVPHGDGGDRALRDRIRAHGDFGEYVPLARLVIGLPEGAGGGRLPVEVLHPLGPGAVPNAARQSGCRELGILSTPGAGGGAVAPPVRAG